MKTEPRFAPGQAIWIVISRGCLFVAEPAIVEIAGRDLGGEAYLINNEHGKFIARGTGTFATRAEAQAEADRRNA